MTQSHGPSGPVLRDGRRAAPDAQRGAVLCGGSAPFHALVARALGETHDVVIASDGRDALRLARRLAPEALVYEHAPPVVDGLRVLSVMKSDPALFTIPIVLLWNTIDPADIERGLDLGADDILGTSVEPAVLRARIRASVRSRAALRQLVSKHAELTRLNGVLTTSRARTRAIIESAHDGILMLLPQGGIESANPAARRALGLADEVEAGQRSFLEFVSHRDQEQLVADLAAAIAPRPSSVQLQPARELTGIRADAAEFPLECRLIPVETPAGRRVCAFLRDLTESKRLMLELQQAQKLESVGRLAAGIAHEINTPIQYIGDNTNFLREAFEHVTHLLSAYQQAANGGGLDPHAAEALASACEAEDVPYFLERTPETIDRTLQGVERVASIVRAMKEFAHPDQSEMVSTDLNRAIQATLDVARNEYKYVATVRTELGPIPLVHCHGSEVNQVFLNLIVNAAHAIGDVVKGTSRLGEIVVTTRAEATEVVVTVADNGGGIPEAIRGRVFDPFFTTKEVGRGSGQGLAVAHSVVKKHRGKISFESTVGQGTAFEVRLPIEPARSSPA